MGLHLIPVYNLQAVFNSWHLYVAGIEAVLRNSGDDTNIEKIYNEIMAGNLLLWVGFVDDKYAGFLTTSFAEVPMSGRSLWILHTFKVKKVHTNFLLEGLKIVEQFAKEKGCKSVKFYALRKPWLDKFSYLGYNEGYVEMIKNLYEGKNGNIQGLEQNQQKNLCGTDSSKTGTPDSGTPSS